MKNKYTFILRLALVAFVGSIGSAFAQNAASDDSNITPQEIAARQANLRGYFHRLEERRNPLVTKTMPDGDAIDFVTRDPNQPTPPPGQPDNSPAPDGKPAVHPQTWLQKNPTLQGPSGTVPMARFDVESYLSHVKVPAKDPRNMFTPPFTAYNDGKGDNLYYVRALFSVGVPNVAGVSVVDNLWKTYGPVADQSSSASTHTLFEMAVASSANGGVSNLDTIEIGTTQDEGLNGMNNIDANGNQSPYLFIFFTTNGYSSNGDFIGGYNTQVQAYHQYATSFGPGVAFLPGFVSVYQGNQVEISYTALLYQGNWWLYVSGQPMGYYPAFYFHTLATGGIKDGFQFGSAYGEVATGTDQVDGNGMGSGVPPVVGDSGTVNYTRSSYARQLSEVFLSGSNYGLTPLAASGTASVDPFTQVNVLGDVNCYSSAGVSSMYHPDGSPFYSNTNGLTNFWYYGGPGSGNPACLP